MNLPAIAWDLIQAQHRATIEHAERHGHHHRQRTAPPRPVRGPRSWNLPRPRRRRVIAIAR